ncbi:DedA family protein [Nocardioides flavescens]|uniref:DedA family protein n=1 Tax=Nocardioides flavescens TaxID=2691959 RepID=A0A6L7EXG4_9ACTN|nr:DedA family protein [Nocardioides flavescens]MXG91510.1 DedA family protein [Nocardioides flavescens]
MTVLLTPLMLALGTGAVALLAAVVFVESGVLLGFFLPGDSLLFTGGLLVASGVIHLPVAVVIAVVAVAAVLGDQLGYTLGRRLGPRVFSGRASRFLSPAHLARAERFFERHGSRAVVLARFVPVVRTLVPFLAGTAAMPRGRFTTRNAVGGVLWAAGVVLAGFFLGGVPFVAHHVELVVVGVVALSLVPVAVSLAVRRLTGRDAADDAAHDGEARELVGAGSH